MPGSLLYSPPSPRSRVSRPESTRSDHSDGSITSQSSTAGKKVSFNKAVRIKKFSRSKKSDSALPNGGIASNGGSPEKKFWFKVYKNKHRQSPDLKELSHNNGVIYYDNDFRYADPNCECGTQTPPPPRFSGLELHPLSPYTDHQPLHQSQMPTETSPVKKNHVKKIVSKFNEEALTARQRSLEDEITPPPSPHICPRTTFPFYTVVSPCPQYRMQRVPTPPPEPPIYYPSRQSMSSKLKKNPIINGVKVMFGMGHLKKKDKSTSSPDLSVHKDRRVDQPNLYIPTNGGTELKRTYKPYKTEIMIPDDTELERRTARNHRLSYAKDIRLDSENEVQPKSRGGLFSHDEEGNANDDYDNFYSNENNDDYNQRHGGKCHVETWDSGNQLVFDTTDVNTSSSRLDNGEMFCTVGENHQLWRNNKRMIIVEEPSPIITRRKAKSHTDLSDPHERSHSCGINANVDKGISIEQLSNQKYERSDSAKDSSKDSWMKLWTSTKDRGVQCNQVPTRDNSKPEEIYAFGKYKVLKPRNGVSPAHSNVSSLGETNIKSAIHNGSKDEYNSSYNGDIYSIVDKTKKRRDQNAKKTVENFKSGNIFKSRSEPLYIGPPPRSVQSASDDQEISFYDNNTDRTIKTSSKSFGFQLSPGREEIGRKAVKKFEYPIYKEENWYDIEDDVKSAERHKTNGRHRDTSEVRHELDDDDFLSDLSSNGEHKKTEGGAASVMREVDFKKREISYENVPRSEEDCNGTFGGATNSGTWFRNAEEDYRREMAQNEVSYPAGNHVGSDRFYTVSRTEKNAKQKAPSSPRAYTLDRRHFKDQKKKTVPNTSGVKILVNGQEVSEKAASFKKNKNGHHVHRKYRVNEDPSSVQSDPLYVRGGLAAAYQARQRAAVRRSNSSIAGSAYRQNSPVVRRRLYQTNSDMSGASSETESACAHRPLIMYIPGVSHRGKLPDQDDRSSGANVARSQSMMHSSKPAKITSKSSKSHRHKSNSKPDLYHRDEHLEYEDEITPLASETSRKKPPKVPHDSRKNGDIKRSHSMPKDTKFSWLKWKIKGKPSREP